MEPIKENIESGKALQWVIGDNRMDAYITGTYTIVRGALRQSGQLEIGSGGMYSSSYVGADCGVGISASLVKHKILLKVTADTMDSNKTTVKFNLRRLKI